MVSNPIHGSFDPLNVHPKKYMDCLQFSIVYDPLKIYWVFNIHAKSLKELSQKHVTNETKQAKRKKNTHIHDYELRENHALLFAYMIAWSLQIHM